MKTITTTVLALALTTSAAFAQPFSLSNKVVSEYNIDTEIMTIDWTPTVDMGVGPANLAVSSEINIVNDETFNLLNTWEEGSRPDIDFKATYDIWENMHAHAETSWDLNKSEMGETTVGVSFSF